MRLTSGEDRNGRIQRLLKEGKKKYIGELGKQLNQLREECGWTEPEVPLESAKKIYRIVHTLRGSAPMFEFIRIGVIAQRLVDPWSICGNGRSARTQRFPKR